MGGGGEAEYYNEWQTRYDRTVIARLVKTRQDGFFSAGGLLGLGDVTEWSRESKVHKHQYTVYLSGGTFFSYLPYKSHPGFQGVAFGLIDHIKGIPKDQSLIIFRAMVALASAFVVSFFVVGIGTRISWLSGILTLFFSAFCQWMILPAGSIYWNLWAFFLPFVIGAYVLDSFTERNKYCAKLFQWTLFITILVKILFTGFEIITTVLVMATVPLVFYGIYKDWEWKIFLSRFIQVGIAMSAATIMGLIILSAQIIANDGNFTSAINYVENRLGHHAAGNSEYFFDENIEATRISAAEITGKYLAMPAITIRMPGPNTQILYWHLVVLFAACTVLFFLSHKKREEYPRKAIALIVATWYSVLAPLSWYLLFRPHSIIHTHVNTIGWQMPFTLLGFALCGYVITDLFKRRVA